MPAVVSLQNVVDAMEVPNQGWESLLDPESGEIVTVTEEDRMALEDPEPDLLPKWQREQLPKIRETVESDRYLRLPDSFEIHDWSIMESFSRSVEDPSAGEDLLDAIHGSGAFRAFRRTIERLGLRDQWYSYRQTAYEQIARDWLEANHIPYK